MSSMNFVSGLKGRCFKNNCFQEGWLGLIGWGALLALRWSDWSLPLLVPGSGMDKSRNSGQGRYMSYICRRAWGKAFFTPKNRPKEEMASFPPLGTVLFYQLPDSCCLEVRKLEDQVQTLRRQSRGMERTWSLVILLSCSITSPRATPHLHLICV